jgi:hypothetical protein
MQYFDDRTLEQKATHRWLVIAKDRFMSGWGGASGGASWCGWACDSLANAERLESWVNGRNEMRRVRIVKDEGKRLRLARACVHFHLYHADASTHPAFHRA